MGRVFCRKDALSSPDYWITNIYSRLKLLDSKHEDEYDVIMSRIKGSQTAEYGISPSHTHFYRSDYTLHVRPHYSIGLRNVSKRTVRCESLNGENLLGYFVSDGSYNLSRTGSEYYNVLPLWDWYKVPGTTTPNVSSIPFFNGIPQDETGRGRADFMGGVSDSLYGVTAVQYYDPVVNTGVSKAWFFFDDEIVCLGSGIKTDNQCMTSINQCWGKDFIVGTTNGEKFKYGLIDDLVRKDISYVVHDSIGYYFPIQQDVFLSNKNRENSWDVINQSEKGVEKGRVFTIAIDQNEKDTYQYIIVPSCDEQDMSEYVSSNDIEIIENSDRLQLVQHRGSNLLMGVFYEAGRFQSKTYNLVVDKPCIFMIHEISSGIICHVVDPLYSKAIIHMNIETIHEHNIRKYTGVVDFSNLSDECCGKTLSIQLSPTTIDGIDSIKDNEMIK